MQSSTQHSSTRHSSTRHSSTHYSSRQRCEPRPAAWQPVLLPVSDIDADALTRDRMVIDEAGMAELTASVREHGVRSAIEVMPTADGRYALVSGLRRLRAVISLTGPDARIPAVILSGRSRQDAYAAMVEENEIRADLSPYERGRIAAVAAEEGVFPDLKAAVDHLFAASPKAKRSKIRALGRVHQWLGDILIAPHLLGERICLRMARAISEHGIPAVRAVLQTGSGVQVEGRVSCGADEIAAGLDRLTNAAPVAAPSSKPSARHDAKPVETCGAGSEDRIDLGQGLTLHLRRIEHGVHIGLRGRRIDDALVGELVESLRRVLVGP